jgi:hypothetical protein
MHETRRSSLCRVDKSSALLSRYRRVAESLNMAHSGLQQSRDELALLGCEKAADVIAQNLSLTTSLKFGLRRNFEVAFPNEDSSIFELPRHDSTFEVK